MECSRSSNCWKVVFVLFIAITAFIGYRLHWSGVKNSPVSVTIGDNGEVSAQKEVLEKTIKEYILNNPDIIIESIELMHKRKMKEMEDKIQGTIKDKKAELEDTASAPYVGNDKGDVSIVMFYDYGCGYCKKANSIVNSAIASDSNVKVVYRPLPILGEASEYLSKLMLAVYKIAPSKFKAIHDDVMEFTTLDKKAVAEAIEKHGVNFADVEIEMSKPEVKDMYLNNMKLASELHINGAPAFIINSSFFPGLLELNNLQKIIADKRAEGASKDKVESANPEKESSEESAKN